MRFLPSLLLALALSGCAVPYNVGQTAQTTPKGAVLPDATFQYASHDRLREPDEDDGPTFMISNGVHLGLDAYSDVGLRLVGPGAVVTYARRLTGDPGSEAGTTVIGGGGILLGEGGHAHLEASVVTSSDPFGELTPYGGARLQFLGPFGSDNESVGAIGVFGGLRLGQPDLAILPEIGIFYSPTDRFGETSWIVAPSVSVRGEGLLRALGL
ncbi:MAG: hypothetical protein AAGI52_03100 [Bacteroidota bacterium]